MSNYKYLNIEFQNEAVKKWWKPKIEKEKLKELREQILQARKHFKNKVYKTVIPRNVRLSEAPSHGLPCVVYDKTCSGSKSYFKLAEEFLDDNNTDVESAA